MSDADIFKHVSQDMKKVRVRVGLGAALGLLLVGIPATIVVSESIDAARQRAAIDALEVQRSELLTQVEGLKSDRGKLEEVLPLLRQEEEDLRIRAETALKTIDDAKVLDERKERLLRSVEDLKTEENTRNARINDLIAREREIQTQVQNAEQEAQTRADDVIRLKLEQKRVRGQIEDLNSEKRRFEEVLPSLRQEEEDLRIRAETARKTIDDAKVLDERKERLLRSVEDLKTEENTRNARVNDLSVREKELRTRIQNAEQEAQTKAGDVKRLELKRERLVKQNQRARADLDITERELDDAKGELRAVREEVARLESERREIESKLKRLQGIGRAAKDDVERLEREYMKIMEELSEASTKLEITLKRLEDKRTSVPSGGTEQ